MASKPGAGAAKECDKGTGNLFVAEPGHAERQLLAHEFEVNPHSEDLDVSANVGSGGAAPAGRIEVAAGATESVFIPARPGFVLYIDSIKVKRADGNADLSLVTVAAKANGVQVAFVPETTFSRRVFLDREKVLVVSITNGTAGPLKFEYAVTGFARRAGLKTLPDRSVRP